MFNRARLTLTGWYLLIIMLISIFFSAVIYEVLIHEVERFAHVQQIRIERRIYGIPPGENELVPMNAPTTIQQDIDLVLESKRRILMSLVVVNGAIIILAGAFGYVLAGRTLRPIQEMVEEQNRFISDASHELKTPLTSLKTAFEVSLRDPLLTLDDAKELISESIIETNKLQQLSEGLLDLSKHHAVASTFSTISVSGLFDEAAKNIHSLARAKQITIEKQQTNLYVLGDKESLIKVLVILLDNAIKYSQQKSSVRLSASMHKNTVSLSVADKGIGIAKKDIPYIFNRFYRADTARTKKDTGGYGLGLSIAKKIIDLHHGTIRVESKAHKGTTVIVELTHQKHES